MVAVANVNVIPLCHFCNDNSTSSLKTSMSYGVINKLLISIIRQKIRKLRGIMIKYMGISKRNNAQKREHNLLKPTPEQLLFHSCTGMQGL